MQQVTECPYCGSTHPHQAPTGCAPIASAADRLRAAMDSGVEGCAAVSGPHGIRYEPMGPDHDTRDQEGRGWGPDDCPACGAPPGEEHGCGLAERSQQASVDPDRPWICGSCGEPWLGRPGPCCTQASTHEDCKRRFQEK